MTVTTHTYPEIWENIFEFTYCQNDKEPNLSSSDVYNCSQVCTNFRNILHPTRTTWLFREILPFLIYSLDGKSVLACRSVCKKWKLAVDNLIENENDYLNVLFEKGVLLPVPLYQLDFDYDTSRLRRRTYAWKDTIFEITIRIRSGNHITQFCQDFITNGRNPVPGRTLHIGNPLDNEDYSNYWKVDVMELLSRFGDHIHNLHLEMDKGRCPLAIIVNVLTGCLHLTPNLRRLRITRSNHGLDDLEIIHIPPNETIHFPPKLPHLISIEFPNRNFRPEFGSTPFVLQQFIALHYAQQLHQLQLFPSFEPKTCRIEKMPVQKLKQLKVKVTHSTDLWELFRRFTLFEPIDYTYTSLHSVIIEIVNGRDQLGEFLHILQMFKSSLKTLFIISPFNLWETREKVSEKDLEMLKELSNLEYLQIEGFKFGGVNIADSLPCKLRYIMLDYKGDLESMDMYMYRSNSWNELLGPGVSADLTNSQAIYDSPLWNRLSKLRCLSVKYCNLPIRRYNYRRENWEVWVGKTRLERIWESRILRVKRGIQIFRMRMVDIWDAAWYRMEDQLVRCNL